MVYRVVYDVTRDGLSHMVNTEWPAFVIPCIFPIVIVFILKWGDKPWKRNGKEVKVRRSIRKLLVGFLALMSIGAPTCIFADYWTLRSALIQKRCKVAEGRVTNYSPMPAEGHKEESFNVNGEFFHYSDFSLTAGFNNATSLGGPIREGLQVRIYYLNNELALLEEIEIAKLEVASEQ